MTTNDDVRTTAWLAISGGVLAILGNVLHPFIDADTGEEFLAAISDSGAIWMPVHLAVAVSLILLTAALVVSVRLLTGTAGERLGRLAAVSGVITAPIFIGQIAGLDGTALKTLADEAAAGDASAAAAADTLIALDFGLLTVSITFYLGATLLLFGYAVVRGEIVASWAGWMVTAGGAIGLVAGLILWVAPDNQFALDVLFRGGAMLSTVGVLSLGVLLRRKGTVPAPATAAA